MGTAPIDSLVVELGLDPKKFNQGQKEALAAFKKTQEEAARLAKEMEARGEQAAGFFGKIKREAIGFFATLVGANGIKDFVAHTVTSDAALGRMAHNLNLSTASLSKWQIATTRAGGTAEDATSAFQSLVSVYERAHVLGERPPNSGIFARLGITSLDQLKDAEGSLLKISEVVEHMDAAKGVELMRGIGIPEGLMPLLQKGPKAVTDELAKAPNVTEASSKAARDLQKAWRALGDEATSVGRSVRDDAAPALTGFLNLIDAGIVKFPQAAKLLTQVGVAATGLATALTTIAAIKFGGGLIGRLFGGGAAAEGAATTAASVAGAAGPGLLRSLGGAAALGLAVPKSVTSKTAMHDQHAKEHDQASRAYDWLRDKITGFNSSELNKSDIDSFVSMGWTPEQAMGIVANLQRESSGNAKADKGDGGKAYGLASWHKDRQDAFAKWAGHDIRQSSRDEQLRFVDYELRSGSDAGARQAGKLLSQATNRGSSAAIFSKYFERPKDTAGEIGVRTALAANLDPTLAYGGQSRSRGLLDLGGSSAAAASTKTEVNIGRVDVHTKATDAAGIAKDLAASIKRQSFVSQANTGLQ